MPTPISSEKIGYYQILKSRITTIRKNIRWMKTEKWLLSGEELQSREKLTVFYTGLPQNMRYFAEQIFGDNYSKQYLGAGKFWPPANMPGRNHLDCSLVVIEGLGAIRGFFLRKGFLYIPAWIGGGFVLPGDLSVLLRQRSLEADRRRIRQNKLTFQVTRDLSKFAQFYYEMYKPHIEKRYDQAAFIPSYEEVRRTFKKCFLVMIEKDGLPIGGAMVSCSGEKGRLHLMGIKDGDRKYVQAGALVANYYYTAKFLHAAGCRWLNLGFSRPFLDDGVLCYKRKWGYNITQEFRSGFYIRAMENTPAVKAFLQRKPFVVTEKGAEYAVMINESYENCQRILDDIQCHFWPKSVDGIILCSLQEDGSIKRVSKKSLTISKPTL